MKICFVGSANSSHLVKWCQWFSVHGHELHVISFTPGEIPDATVHVIDLKVDVNGSDFGKLKYLTTGKQIKKLVQAIKPDVINVHYATSYGLAVALSGIKDYVLSVWGSDIFDFPERSLAHRLLLKYSLHKARYLFSTSQTMADEAVKYTKKKFLITPFGVDMELFSPARRTKKSDQPFVIGTVKTLSSLYGIDYILKAAAIIREEHPEMNIALRIAGSGPQAEEYRVLVSTLGISDITSFLGYISQEKAAEEWANMDVAVIPSVSYESFGVAAVEAQACGVPVIVSDVGGLMETTSPGKSSIVVPRRDEKAIAEAIVHLYQDAALRKSMGLEGRKNVVGKYELNQCFRHIERALSQMSR